LRIIFPVALFMGAAVLTACVTPGHIIAMPPPARYAKKPLPPVQYIYTSHDDALRMCGPPHPENRTGSIACAILGPRCQIVMGPGTPPGTREHEEAHCKGWPGDHPALTTVSRTQPR
jgi:hypothetical protein